MFQLRDNRYNEVRLVFHEAEHKYNDSLGNNYISTTTILGRYKEKFDRDYWLKKKAKELNISEKRLAKQWQDITDEACARGTKTHDGIENAVRGLSKFKEAVQYLDRFTGDMITVADIPRMDINIKELDINAFIELTENKYPEIYNVLGYYANNGYKIYAELGTFLIDYLVSGMIDILCVREDGFVIGDWKTNRGGLKFESGYFKKDKTQTPHQHTNEWIPKKDMLLPPVNNLPACNGSIYNLQLSLYAYTVEYILGIPCRGLWLAHIDSDFVLNEYGQPKRFPDGLYHVKKNPVEQVTLHKMPYRKEEIQRILSDRYREVSATRIQSKTLFD